MSNSTTSKAKRVLDSAKADNTNVPDDAASLLHSIVDGIARQQLAKQDKVGDASPHLSMPPLFPNKDEVATGERAHEKALAIFQAQKIDIDDVGWLKSKLICVAQEYKTTVAQDTRVTYSDMKKEVARLQSDLAKTMERLNNLSIAARHALKAGVVSTSPERVGPHPDYVGDFYTRGVKLNEACISISSRKNTKVSHSCRFQRCAKTLWEIREKITGKKLSETFEIHDGAFTTHDAAFVHAVMEAIDEKVTASQVQEGLRRAAQAKRRRR